MLLETTHSVQVVGLGQACVDYLGRLPDFPAEDEKVELEELLISCGGPAATAMVTLSRLGVSTTFLGSLSDDPFGVRIVEGLKAEDVDISCLKITPGHSSQFAFIAVTGEGGKRTIFWKRSSAPALLPDDVLLTHFPNARMLHIDGLMIEASRAAASTARERGMTVVMDAGTLRQGTLELVSLVDVLIGSERFAESLSESGFTYEETLQKVLSMGPRQVVFTLGSNGSVGLDPNGVVHEKAFKVASRDTTGAGDVYHGAYIYGLLQGWDMAACMRFGSAAAAVKCAHGGGWRGIPDLQAVHDLMHGVA
ncbi:MAG: PfkB family carbohydrate kinase [Deltaproteobacteria bacterium]|nr:PfkB family carbohydrate kinase [Deltaproteobacteria bacterium]